MRYGRQMYVIVIATSITTGAGTPAMEKGGARGATIASVPTSGVPAFDTARLKALDGPLLTAAQKTELGLRFLREEIARPTPRPGPPYTDFKTHDYVLARIVRKLAECGADPTVLRKARETAEGELKNCLNLGLLLSSQGAGDQALGVGDQGSGAGVERSAERKGTVDQARTKVQPAGEGKGLAKGGGPERGTKAPAEPRQAISGPLQELRDEVSTYVRNVKHPLRLRELAAEALGAYAVREQDPSVGPLLAELARRDPHSCYKAGKDGKPTGFIYPVKRAASVAITRMQKAKLELPSYVSAAASLPYERPLRGR